MNMPLVLLNRRRRGNVFTPSGLFALAEPGVWYDPSDLTTLFQDTAGTTPVTTPGQTVALALDKSKGLVLGPELVVNGDFSAAGTSGWVRGFGSVDGTFVNSGGVATYTLGAGDTLSARMVYTLSGLVSGNTYRLNFTSAGYSGTGDRVVVWTSSSAGTGGTTLNQGAAAGWSGQSRSFLVTATATTMYVAVGFANGGPIPGGTVSIDNISVRELPGAHATQSTAASRPTYGIVPLGGRRNLLTYSEQFDNAAWTKTSSTVTANADTAPDGTLTADALIEDGSTANHLVQLSSSLASATYRASIYVKPKDGRRYCLLYVVGFNGGQYFDLQGAGAVLGTQGNAPTSPTVSAEANGYYRVSFTFTGTATTFQVYTSDNGTRFSGFAGSAGSGLFIWGAQLETGSTATAYQRVGSAFDVTEAGVASLSYLSFDGVDDFLVTPTITPNTDKAQVFAGVRKLSDAAIGVVVESSASTASNAGSFYVSAPDTAGGANYGMRSGGSLRPVSGVFTTYTSPISNVLAGLFDIAGDQRTARINGAQVGTDASDQGTGNFLAYPLYIGRRAGTSLPFNGNIFSLVVRFGANLDASTITNTERWVGGKTGVTI